MNPIPLWITQYLQALPIPRSMYLCFKSSPTEMKQSVNRPVNLSKKRYMLSKMGFGEDKVPYARFKNDPTLPSGHLKFTGWASMSRSSAHAAQDKLLSASHSTRDRSNNQHAPTLAPADSAAPRSQDPTRRAHRTPLDLS